MGDDRHRRLRALLATGSSGGHSPNGTGNGNGNGGLAVVEVLGRVCAVAVAELGVSGAGVTVMAGVAAGLAGSRDQVCATNGVSRGLEDLQLTTGEGPCLDAYAAGAPVLVAELAPERARWPGFAPEALALGAAAVFSFPLQVGVVRLGTLDLYRYTPGALGADELADALVLAGAATEALLGQFDDRSPPDGEVELGWLPDVHAEVHQASGMLSVRFGMPVANALLRIRAHAFTEGVSITEVARRIVGRELTLEPDE